MKIGGRDRAGARDAGSDGPGAVVRCSASIALSVLGPLLAYLWQRASIEFTVHEPDCEQMVFHLVGGGYGLVALLSMTPMAALMLAARRSATLHRTARVLALVSAALMAMFWWQLIGLAECRGLSTQRPTPPPITGPAAVVVPT